jgi:hypothetical protein
MASGILRSAYLDLPTELVLGVVDHLTGDAQTLCSLARTSRALQHIAEEHIYKTIVLTTVRGLHSIIEAFSYRHERVRAVQTLRLQYHYDVKELGDNMDARKMFNECVAHMVNLREWVIESPYDNQGHWEDDEGPADWVNGDMERFRAAMNLACIEGPIEAQRIQAEQRLGSTVDRTIGLALLERLVIHSHGIETDFWDLGDFHCLFRHPSLRQLHVSCVSLMHDIPALADHTRKTPLNTLVFDECEISPDALRAILRTPAKLKHLTLGENVWNARRTGRPRERLNKSPVATLDALSEVAHSLETLIHLDPTWKLEIDNVKPSRMSPIGEGMRAFHTLRHLECEITSFLHQAFIMNHELAPPNLKTLRLRRHWTVSVDFFDCPPEVETYLALPSLKELELMQESHCWNELSQASYICDEQRLRTRHAYAYKLFNADINLRVFISIHRDSDIIPPYLYGEALPIMDCVYNAADVGFRFFSGVMTDKGLVDDNGILQTSDVPEQAVSTSGSTPATDQLPDVCVQSIKNDVHHTLHQLKNQFIRHRRLRRAESILEFMEEASDDEDAEFDIEYDEDDLEEEEMDMDEMDEDDMGVVFHEHNGELYIEVYESETDEDEDGMDDMGVDEGVASGEIAMEGVD